MKTRLLKRLRRKVLKNYKIVIKPKNKKSYANEVEIYNNKSYDGSSILIASFFHNEYESFIDKITQLYRDDILREVETLRLEKFRKNTRLINFVNNVYNINPNIKINWTII